MTNMLLAVREAYLGSIFSSSKIMSSFHLLHVPCLLPPSGEADEPDAS